MDFKDTLNLPDPDFTIPMKAGLPMLEPGIQARWDEIDVYHQAQALRKDAKTFVLHDGPPYTNGPVHIGTSLNKVLKDFVVKSRMVMGYRAPYVPGFDNHGLPIEQAVMKQFNERKETPTKVELRKACREHASTYVALQTGQFKRLGVFGLWEKPYTTMDYRFEAEIVRVFKRLVERGFVYRGLRPTLWSPTAQTALADTEIVYQDVTSKSIFVRFPLRPGQTGLPTALQGIEEVYAVIWTTTPWTIPANLALAFHPEYDYAVVDVDESRYILLDQLVEQVAGKLEWSNYEKRGVFKGAEIENVRFRHPVYDRDSLAVLADYVTTEDGTGVVHTAPGHGRDDFFTGQKYGLPVLCPVDERGILTAEAGEFAGIHYKTCDTVVADRLRELGNLLAEEDYQHSYPHAERDGQPVIFRATEQWFVSMDHNGLRDKMVDEIDHKVKWFPASGHDRIRTMIAGRPDWCVSRQRPWGVGIPVFYGKPSGQPVLDPIAIESVAALVAREGSDAWYERAPEEILPPGYAHPETGETEFRKETDVFDVWFDSGSTSLVVLEGNVEAEWREDWPADLYLEGSDQHRGWFNLSLIIGTAVRGEAPYRAVMTHGFVNDEKGQKMSKRLGNVVDPDKVCQQYGADVLRYWSASVDYEEDVPCGDSLLKAAGEGYRRIRNTLRYLLGNLYDYDPTVRHELLDIDAWIVGKTATLVLESLEDFEKYRFNGVLSAVHNFCVNQVSAFYLDAIKDRMYCDGPDWPGRRSGQRACYEVLWMLNLLIAPILPHTAEETYARIPGERRDSVFFEAFDRSDLELKRASDPRIDRLIEVRAWVFGEFEKWKATSDTRDPQDVELEVSGPADEMQVLDSFGDELAILFKMAGVKTKVGDRSVTFHASQWGKCDRCRLRRPDVQAVSVGGESALLCSRDRRVLGL